MIFSPLEQFQTFIQVPFIFSRVYKKFLNEKPTIETENTSFSLNDFLKIQKQYIPNLTQEPFLGTAYSGTLFEENIKKLAKLPNVPYRDIMIDDFTAHRDRKNFHVKMEFIQDLHKDFLDNINTLAVFPLEQENLFFFKNSSSQFFSNFKHFITAGGDVFFNTTPHYISYISKSNANFATFNAYTALSFVKAGEKYNPSKTLFNPDFYHFEMEKFYKLITKFFMLFNTDRNYYIISNNINKRFLENVYHKRLELFRVLRVRLLDINTPLNPNVFDLHSLRAVYISKLYLPWSDRDFAIFYHSWKTQLINILKWNRMYFFSNPEFKYEFISYRSMMNILVQKIIWDFSIDGTFISMIITLFVFYLLYENWYFHRNKIKTLSKGQYILETLYHTVCGIAYENIDHNAGKKYFPFLFTLFIFILFSNLVGLIPFVYTITAQLIITFTLAFIAFSIVNFVGVFYQRKNFFVLFTPAGVPIPLFFLLVPIEFISYIFRVISLAVRLFANMMAGHTLLHVIMDLLCHPMFTLKGSALKPLTFSKYISVSAFWFNLPLALAKFTIGLVLCTFLYALEIGVAMIQAYVFTVLTSIYLNDVRNAHHLH